MNTLSLAGAGWLLAVGAAFADAPVVEEDTWTETYPVANSAHLEIGNIWGSVRVRAGQPGEITVTVSERRSAPDSVRFRRSLELYRLDTQADLAGVSLVVGDREDRWHRDQDCRECRAELQFEVRVPPDASIDVATVMDGTVSVSGVGGTISARNVNGPVTIDHGRDCRKINSVNGKVRIGFSQAPQQDCSIQTINGDITLDVPGDTGLNLAMELFNGNVASELPVGSMPLPATVEETTEDGHRRYRIQQMAGLRIGPGGPTYTVSSMNGDLEIRKQQ